MIDKREYLERVYAGLLGKCVGVRLGAPVEPTIWSYDLIQRTYGEIRGYIKSYTNFAADDDVNGPLFFIRALWDYGQNREITARDIGNAWLNYTREGIGFFWWGGYGRSTEHTAYLNLKNGLVPPKSGSIEVNGKTIAEQIGGQIFIDSWGLVNPGNLSEAARYGEMAASVSHDRNGIYGGIFMACAIAAAFTTKDIEQIIEKALLFIPADSEYCRVFRAVKEFYRENSDNWRKGRDFLEKNFGYDRYPGVCHMIPNAGVCALSLYYGEGDFSRTIEIATMSGWDTDCNAGNVGTILGVMVGVEGIPHHYRLPINDFHAASSIAGALNTIDLPTASRELAILGMKLQNEAPPEEWRRGAFSDSLYLDFSLPGSTCGMRSSNSYLLPMAPCQEREKPGSVTFTIDRIKRGDRPRIFYKPYYCREDFDDERYSPTFTPTIYPGQTAQLKGSLNKESGDRVLIIPYVSDGREKTLFEGEGQILSDSGSFECKWTLPAVPFAISEVGIIVETPDKEKYLGSLSIEQLQVFGKKSFFVDFKDESIEFNALSRCSLSGGAWEVTPQGLHVITNRQFQLFTGPYYWKEYTVEAKLIPLYGTSHLLSFRCPGALRGYHFGLQGENRASLIRSDDRESVLWEGEFLWEKGEVYSLKVEATGGAIRGMINGRTLFEEEDNAPLLYGMAGVSQKSPGRTLFLSLKGDEL